MAITQRIKLNLIPNNRPVVIPVNQNDEGVDRLVFEMDMVGSGTVTIQGTRPDGGTFTHPANVDGRIVTADLFTDMASAYGDVYTQLVFDDGTDRTGSQAFILRVQKEARI